MPGKFPIEKTAAEWKRTLPEDAHRVLREHGTEPAFRNKYDHHQEAGTYECAGCGQPLFRSADKYDSGSGWPSFFQPIKQEAVGEDTDRRFGMNRTEIHCSQCGGHIGHVFPDGPRPTGLRYCTNSAALRFSPAEDGQEEGKKPDRP